MFTREDIEGTIPVYSITDLKIGDRVFWCNEGKLEDYGSWAHMSNPHPDYLTGYEIKNINIEKSKVTLETHSYDRSVTEYPHVDSFVKVIFKDLNLTPLDKEIRTLRNFGYRNG